MKMKDQSWKITPNTGLGWWSIGLILAMPLLFVLVTSFQNSLYESVMAGGTILAGILAFVTGLLATVEKKREKQFLLLHQLY